MSSEDVNTESSENSLIISSHSKKKDLTTISEDVVLIAIRKLDYSNQEKRAMR